MPQKKVTYEQNALERLMILVSKNPKIDKELIIYAKNFAKKYHKNQKRASGDPYYLHAIEVSIIISDIILDQDVIIASLLHDIVEDTSLVLPQIGIIFGGNILSMVNKLTKLDVGIKKLRLAKDETLNKLGSCDNKEDKYSILIKLADRIHNMRTLDHIPSINKRYRIAQETLKFFVPLARHFKIHSFEKELTILSTKIIKQYKTFGTNH